MSLPRAANLLRQTLFKPLFVLSFLGLSVSLGVTAAHAHHSFAATFNDGEKIAVEGVVTEFSFKNPHVLVYLDVTNDDGSVTNWMSEGAAATSMRTSGWTRDIIKTGDRVRIHGNSTHDSSPMVSMDSIDLLDPETGELIRTLSQNRDRSNLPAEIVKIPLLLDDGRPNLTGAWVQIRRPGRRTRPTDLGGEPPYNEVGAAAQAVYDRSDDPQIFCEPPGVIRQSGFTPHPVKITQNADHVIFEYEEYGGYRVVQLGDELPAPGEKSHLGDSVAHYDGEALIVRTVNLLSNPSQPLGHRTSGQVSTVETYTRADEADLGAVLSMVMVISDPVFYDGGTWILPQTKRYSEGYGFIENECRPPLRERKIDKAVQISAVIIPPPEPPTGPEEEDGPGILERLEGSALAIFVAESLYGYPIALGLHSIGLAIVVGLLMFVDLRLLNFLTEIPLSSLRPVIRIAWGGFAVNAISGFALFSSQATYFMYHTPFLIKISLIALGVSIAAYLQRQLRRNAASWDDGSQPISIKAVAAISLVCWFGAIIAGRLIAYL